jgi:hypothetical protein
MLTFNVLTTTLHCTYFNSECMILGCLASWAVNVLFQWDALPFYLVHILVWFLSDWIMLSVVQVRIATCTHAHSDKLIIYCYYFF